MVSIPRYQAALRNIVSSLKVGSYLAVLDFKLMETFPGSILNPIFNFMAKVTHQDLTRKPWLYMEDLLVGVEMRGWKYAGLFSSNLYLDWAAEKLIR